MCPGTSDLEVTKLPIAFLLYLLVNVKSLNCNLIPVTLITENIIQKKAMCRMRVTMYDAILRIKNFENRFSKNILLK